MKCSFLSLFFILFVRNRCGHRRLSSGRIQVVSAECSLERLVPMKPFYFEFGSVRTARQNEHDSNEARGEEEKTPKRCKTRFKSNADVASRITFLRDLPRRFFRVLFLFLSLSFSLSSIFNHRVSPKRLSFRPLILSISNFEYE